MPVSSFLKAIPVVRGLHLDRSDAQDWTDGAYWLTATLVGGLMPLWLPALFLTLFGQVATVQTFTRNGELALFAASLLSVSFYTVTKDSRWNFLSDILSARGLPPRGKPVFPYQRFFVFISWILTVLSALLFAGAIFSHFPGIQWSLNAPLLTSASIAACGLSVFFGFVVTVTDNAFSNRPDIPELYERSYRDFEKRYDDLQET